MCLQLPCHPQNSLCTNSCVPTDNVTEVRATCHLQVRLVTQDMLHSAVTIRLDRMTQAAFLSQVLSFFLDALAQIFTVPDPPEQNIFLIDVEADTDVSPDDQILNVSVAIRKGSYLERGHTRDVFYAPEYLREVIYLHRALLANLSTLQVLPFDDNLCLVEPCINLQKCHSLVQRGEPRSFISSMYVMLRPIHPVRIVGCFCPRGIADDDGCDEDDVHNEGIDGGVGDNGDGHNEGEDDGGGDEGNVHDEGDDSHVGDNDGHDKGEDDGGGDEGYVHDEVDDSHVGDNDGHDKGEDEDFCGDNEGDGHDKGDDGGGGDDDDGHDEGEDYGGGDEGDGLDEGGGEGGDCGGQGDELVVVMMMEVVMVVVIPI
ncbi:cadherin EGF LAG seven-pass G-type receptor 1 [Elysia marginata]|uniref:Cadherin EGF LAG seven-pass G-type receptor 1 n=1 Tax=Elysia marginata TaxID=1093978 RepID=A0AAV4F9I8_9GAST|nr:cadherin EGF LAG seven-pass G-type receptor 1 [Elysia marginata]